MEQPPRWAPGLSLPHRSPTSPLQALNHMPHDQSMEGAAEVLKWTAALPKPKFQWRIRFRVFKVPFSITGCDRCNGCRKGKGKGEEVRSRGFFLAHDGIRAKRCRVLRPKLVLAIAKMSLRGLVTGADSCAPDGSGGSLSSFHVS